MPASPLTTADKDAAYRFFRFSAGFCIDKSPLLRYTEIGMHLMTAW